MARLDVRGLAWAVNRWFLVRGAVAWVSVIGAAVILIALLMLAGAYRKQLALKAKWERQAQYVVVEDGEEAQPTSLPFPTFEERFEYTGRTLEALRIDESLPGKIAFSYDRNEDSGLIRQTATLNVDSRWQEVGGLLDRAQTAIPTAYISRLNISRDTDDDPVLGAEVQFTLVYRDLPQGGAE